jgi:hypothetical protein
MESPALVRPGLEVLFLLASETALTIAIQHLVGNARRLTRWIGHDVRWLTSTHTPMTRG